MINSINEEKQFQKANNLFEKMERTKTREGKATVVEYMKKSDNATFGIVREGSQYTIKVTDKKTPVLVAEDFSYIGSYEARKRFQRGTLQEAIKYLHLFLNEEKYVVDVPVVTPPAPAAAPESEPTPESVPTPENMPNPEGMASPDMDMPTDGGDEMGGEGAENDSQKEIQQMTGKLAQELRQEIADGNGTFTVGMFKSLIAPAKDLPSELKAKVMDKAQEVLSDEGNENGGEDSEMEAMNEAIMNLNRLLSEEKKEKVYTEQKVEQMILSQVGSINKLRNAYKTVINDPEVQKLLDTVYHKLFNLKSIEVRKKELHGNRKKEAMKKESAVQSTISHIKKNREMAEEATPVMTARDYKLAGKELEGKVRVVPNDSNFNTLKESKRITLKEFKDMMEEGYLFGSNNDEWEEINHRFNITTPFSFGKLKEYGEVTLDAELEHDGEPLYDKIIISLKEVDNGRNLMLRVEFEPQGEFQGGKISLENKKTEEELDNMILDSIIWCFRQQIKELEERGVF